MAATQKLYRAVATTVAAQVGAERSDEQGLRMTTVSLVIRIAQDFKADSPRFKFGVFYRWCGLPELVKSCDCANHQFEYASQVDWS